MTPLSLSAITSVVITPAVVVTANTVTILKTYDDNVKVEADVQIGARDRKIILLWGPQTTPTYVSIGDWTQAQANARVVEVIEAGL